MDEINIFCDTVFRTLAKSTRIFVGNGFTLAKLNMDDYYVDTFFISDMSLDIDKMYGITNKDLDFKTKLYRFCVNNPDRVFQGTKKYDFPIDNEE